MRFWRPEVEVEEAEEEAEEEEEESELLAEAPAAAGRAAEQEPAVALRALEGSAFSEEARGAEEETVSWERAFLLTMVAGGEGGKGERVQSTRGVGRGAWGAKNVNFFSS
jgi:hypothetical protein